jgi:hypothetical protein
LGVLALALSGFALPACDPAGAAPAAHTGPAAAGVVYVEDHTGPRWPVAQATALWRRAAKGIDIRYGKCRPGGACVKVRECTEAEAQAGLGADSAAVGRAVPARGYQDACLGTGPDDTYLGDMGLAIACHEIGHGLGLGHNEDADSCMQAYVDRAPAHPGRRDIAALNNAVRDVAR